MDKQKKSLLCMYVGDSCGIKEESFNFCIERRYMIWKNVISRKSDEEIKDLPIDFWGKNVSAVTLLIGENGTGKTTLMRLLIKWLCQLSAGNIPQEKGALVISVDGKDKLIAFDSKGFWAVTIEQDENIVCIEDIDEIKILLSDIRLVYYTDTMTDLELSGILKVEELEFLQDESLLTRLSNPMEGKYASDSVKERIKREEFRRQMELLLNVMNRKKKFGTLEFPIRYMKLTTVKAGGEKGFKGIPDGNGSLIGQAIDFWNKVFSDNLNNSLPDIARELLWGLFSGIIVSLFSWEKTLLYMEESIIAELVSLSLRAYIRVNYHDWNTVFKHFFTNLFDDCERAFCDAHYDEAFYAAWGRQVEDNINIFLDALKEIGNGEFLKKQRSSGNEQNTWEFKLEYFDQKTENEPSILKNWKYLWKQYLTVDQLMPECRFDWLYPSSGEMNKANLYCTMYAEDIGICNNMWFLLDEPDNTFHPDWKRKTIQELLDICSIYDINFQIMISTHSPIMLSDVPKQAVILLRNGDKKGNSDKIHNTETKQQAYPESSPFGQQIYTLFREAFFMQHGAIGAFADNKISEVYSILVKFEKYLRRNVISENKLNDYKKEIKKRECIIELVDEPLLRGNLLQIYNWCSQMSKERALHKKK